MKNLGLEGQIRCIMGDVQVAHWFPIWISLDWLRLVFKITKFVYGTIINEIPPFRKISKIYCELYIRREFEINTSLFINFQVFEYGCMYHIQYWPDFKDKLAVCSFWQYVDFITHGLVPKVPSVLSLTCFQFFTISDPAAALSSIMLFLSLDTVHMKGRTTGWSKIPGGPAGEWKATSWCRGTRITNVELPQAPAIL